MEIPTAVIQRLQSSVRRAAGAPSFPDAAAPAPPFPCVAVAVAAFDAGASISASAELRCGRCGAAGGFLRGARSALCAYCGSPRREEGGECEGGGVAFRDGPAYRWLLGSLGLDGSELAEFDNESTGSNKSNEAPKSGMIISDMLDLKLTCLPKKKETPASSISEEQPSAVHTQNLSEVNVDSFFVEIKEEIPAATVFPQTRTVVKDKQKMDSKNIESSKLDMHATSTGSVTSQKANETQATPVFANWDAEFQSATSVNAAADTEQLDLFKGVSAAESFSSPGAVNAINPVVGAGNNANMKSAILEHSEGLAFDDKLFNQKAVDPSLESSSGIAPESSVPDFESNLNKNSLRRDEFHQRDDTGVNDDDGFDDWQDFTGGENQGSLSNTAESNEEHLNRDSSDIKTIDPWPLGSMESPSNVNSDPSDDWQAFTSSSGQKGEDLMKPAEGSVSGREGGLMGLVEETSNTPLEHPSQASSVDLWPMSNVDKHSTIEMVKETNDSFDDWQDFTTSGQVQNISFTQTGEMVEAVTVGQNEIDLDSWFMGDSREAKNTASVNGNNSMLNEWQGLTVSDQSYQNPSKNHPFMHREATDFLRVNSSSKGGANTSATSMDSDGFDILQDFAKSGQVSTMVPPEPGKEMDAMDLCLTNNLKESNNRDDVRRIDDSSDGWQDFATFGQAQKSTKISEESHLVKDHLGDETLNLWASRNSAEKKLEQVNGNNNLFDDWQDFKNSGETSLQVFSDASSLDRASASKPDPILSLEFGTIPGLVSSQNRKDENESSNVAKVVSVNEHSKSTTGMQQVGDVGSLSAIWPTKDAISEPEPVDANVGKLLSQMHDLSFMLKDELSIPDKPVDNWKS